MSANWKTAPLSEFVKEFIVPQRDKPTTFGGDIPWCRIEDFEGPYLSASKSGKCVTTKSVTEMPLRVFPTNTVLVSCSANLGKCAITTLPLVTNQTFIGLVPRDDVDSKFLYYLMGSKSAVLNEMATGVTIRYLSREKFSNLIVSVPSLLEQKRIVRLLDEAFEGIAIAKANAEKNLQNARALFESQLQEVFTQAGDEWRELTLGQICDVEWGNGDLTKSAFVEDGEYLAVSAAGPDGRIGHKEHDKYTPVLSAIGAQCGRMFLPEEDFTAIKNTITMTPRNGTCTGKFLYRMLNFVELPKRGTAQPFISKGDIQSFAVLVPPPEVQGHIVDLLDNFEKATDELVRAYETKLVALEDLKRSFLSKAYSGELSVAL